MCFVVVLNAGSWAFLAKHSFEKQTYVDVHGDHQKNSTNGKAREKHHVSSDRCLAPSPLCCPVVFSVYATYVCFSKHSVGAKITQDQGPPGRKRFRACTAAMDAVVRESCRPLICRSVPYRALGLLTCAVPEEEKEDTAVQCDKQKTYKIRTRHGNDLCPVACLFLACLLVAAVCDDVHLFFADRAGQNTQDPQHNRAEIRCSRAASLQGMSSWGRVSDALFVVIFLAPGPGVSFSAQPSIPKACCLMS